MSKKTASPPDVKFRTIKTRACFADWLKRTAHAEGRFMYTVLEDLCKRALKAAPWDPEGDA